MMSAVVYLTLGGLLTNVVPGTRLKCYFLGAAVVLTLMVGFSRMSMGVHYPTDVLAGWCLGLGWAEICWLIHSQLVERARQREGSSAAPDPRPIEEQLAGGDSLDQPAGAGH